MSPHQTILKKLKEIHEELRIIRNNQEEILMTELRKIDLKQKEISGLVGSFLDQRHSDEQE